MLWVGELRWVSLASLIIHQIIWTMYMYHQYGWWSREHRSHVYLHIVAMADNRREQIWLLVNLEGSGDETKQIRRPTWVKNSEEWRKNFHRSGSGCTKSSSGFFCPQWAKTAGWVDEWVVRPKTTAARPSILGGIPPGFFLFLTPRWHRETKL